MINLKFWRPREKFLILEISPQKKTALLLSLDEEKNLKLQKIWDDFSIKKEVANQARHLKKSKIIISAHPSLVVTVSLPARLIRGNAISKNSLTIVELENLFSKEMGKTFSKERRAASLVLGRSELDTILVGARTDNFKIDGHRVLNPVGFGGKKIEGALELTFTTREIFDELKQFFNSPEGVFFSETSKAILAALSLSLDLPVNAAVFGRESIHLSVLEKNEWGKVLRKETLDWSVNSLLDSLAASFPLSRPVVFRIYEKYISGETSDNFKKFLSRVMNPALKEMFRLLGKIKFRGPLYFYSPLPLPFKAPIRSGRIVMNDLSAANAAEKIGFKIDASEWSMGDDEIFVRLAPFVEFYADKGDSEINRKLRRRLHWLVK